MRRTRFALFLPVLLAWGAMGRGQEECRSAPLNVIFQHENTSQAPELFANETEAIDVEVPSGEIGRAQFYVAIVSSNGGSGDGAQGWQLSLSISGDILPVEATTAGTVAATTGDDPPGIRCHCEVSPTCPLGRCSVDVTTIVDPAIIHPGTGQPQGLGVTSGVVLSTAVVGPRVELDPVCTATVLSLTVEAARPQGEEILSGTVSLFDDMQGLGRPLKNVIVVRGNSETPCYYPTLTVRFRPAEPSDPVFRRGMVNDDENLDLSDGVYLLNFLFTGSAPPKCMDAADTDDNGSLELTDGIRLFQFLFLGGAAPPDPGPEVCGPDPGDEDDLGCGEFSYCP